MIPLCKFSFSLRVVFVSRIQFSLNGGRGFFRPNGRWPGSDEETGQTAKGPKPKPANGLNNDQNNPESSSRLSFLTERAAGALALLPDSAASRRRCRIHR